MALGLAASSSSYAGDRRADLPARMSGHDTSYGRLDGDVALGFGLGGSVGEPTQAALVEGRVRYLEVAGLVLRYEEAFRGGEYSLHRGSVGLEFRPLFLARWATGTHSGYRFLDLTIDSLSFEMAATSSQRASGGVSPGLSVAVGLELPLFARASGLWLRVATALHYSERAIDVGSSPERSLQLSLAWHGRLGPHVVDVGDRPPR